MATAQMFFTIFFVVMLPAQGQLTPDFYDAVCPHALPTIRAVVEAAVALQPRLGAYLVRLHFHDCFVNVRPHLPSDIVLRRRRRRSYYLMGMTMVTGLRWLGVAG